MVPICRKAADLPVLLGFNVQVRSKMDGMEEMEVIDGNEVRVRTYVHLYSISINLISQYLHVILSPLPHANSNDKYIAS